MAKCVSKTTGKELSVYNTKKEALESAKYTKKAHNLDLYPYECEKCGYWHLAPKSSKIKVKKNACPCTDSSGNPKALYGSKRDAEKQRKKSEIEQNIKLRVYKCPHKHGYHLTHTEARITKKKSLFAALFDFIFNR